MKKILSLALAVIMIAAMCAVIVVPTSADETAPEVTYASSWDGTVDYSWFGDTQEKLPTTHPNYAPEDSDVWDGLVYPFDPEKTEYHITNAEQLAAIPLLVTGHYNNFKGVTIYLDVDVVWNAGEFTMDENTFAPLYNGKPVDGTNPVNKWTPIGARTTSYNANGNTSGQFYGNFDGQGHVISGLYVNDDKVNAGFFADFCGGYIKNLSIVNSYFSGTMVNGAFAGFAHCFVDYGAERNIVGSSFTNLYTDAYVVTTGDGSVGGSADKPSTDTRSGGIFGMIRNGGDVKKVGSIWEMKNVWFDGTLAATLKTTYTGGFIGCPAMDEQALVAPNTPKEGGFHKLIMEDCLMTGALYSVTEPSSISPTASIRFGLILGNWYNGTLVVKNVIAAPKATNMTEEYVDANGNKFLGLTKTTEIKVIDPITGAESIEPKTEDRLGKGIFGRWENKNTGDITFENVHMDPIGMFIENRWNVSNLPDSDAVKNGTVEYILNGDVTVDDGLVLALVALAGNTSFDLTTPATPKLVGFKTEVNVNPEDLPYQPPIELPPETEDPNAPGTDVPGTEAPGTDAPATNAPATNAPTTNKPAVTTAAPVEEKGCGGFAAIGAVLALVAVTGAAIVIKKK